VSTSLAFKKPHTCGFFYAPFRRFARQSVLTAFLLTISLPVSAEDTDWRSPETVPGTILINTTEAEQHFNSGAKFIDVRSLRQFNKRHIPGAYHLDLKSDFTVANLQKIIRKNEPAIIYCNGPHCSRSYRAATMAVEWGFSHIFYYREGFRTWRKSGNPIEKAIAQSP
jgi:rhodanese-related sulfurtransferase